MLDARLFLLQRLTALVMAPLVLGHLITMIYAVQGGLSAEEILGRTQGSVFWVLFYGIFVTAVSIHAAIGLRVVLYEWLNVRGFALTVLSWLIAMILLYTGLQAVLAVTGFVS
ncbi:MAG: succinate dehydrogenase [Gammaproteobacteria bacterium]|nr:succinate dehydrogenase [Gammaproteobacteria bacterium]